MIYHTNAPFLSLLETICVDKLLNTSSIFPLSIQVHFMKTCCSAFLRLYIKEKLHKHSIYVHLSSIKDNLFTNKIENNT